MKQVLQRGALLGVVKVKDAGQLMRKDNRAHKNRTATDVDQALQKQGLY